MGKDRPLERSSSGRRTPLRIVSIVGTRPEAIKMAPVIAELARHRDRYESILVTTGQHRELLTQALADFDLQPDTELDLGSANQSLADFAALTLQGVSALLRTLEPAMVLVQGDTTTVAASALAAAYGRIPVGHVEAGLRSFDPSSPFPEELNRQVASVLAAMHFVPTETARRNLLQTAVPAADIFVTGNTIVDALQSIHISDRFEDPVLGKAASCGTKLIVVTCHRRESHGEPLRQVCRAIARLAKLRKDVCFTFPVHPNPVVQKIVHQELDGLDRVHLLAPASYADMLRAMRRAYLVLSDSGGIQEEAPSLNTPLLILRDVTERPEVVEVGAAALVGTSEERIVSAVIALLDDARQHALMAGAPNPFGDGHAAVRIAEAISYRFGGGADKSSSKAPADWYPFSRVATPPSVPVLA